MCASFPVLGTHRRHFGLHMFRKSMLGPFPCILYLLASSTHPASKGTDSWTRIVLWKLLSHGDLRREHKGGIEEGGKEREKPPSYGIHPG
ncbi:hypothetical protein XELAEV_18004898mg [Xenopus laevis]|uniref:Uncharacterized protein n=1 Tax=Xenopus laevis TaxID=8355 RepID=A0A974I251_XENLA|nr:hypothetical protein XELAEV_18004898mg [Xenopus laevis]